MNQKSAFSAPQNPLLNSAKVEVNSAINVSPVTGILLGDQGLMDKLFGKNIQRVSKPTNSLRQSMVARSRPFNGA